MLGNRLKLKFGDVVENNTIIKEIGEGRFSNVYSCRNEDWEELALKIYRNGYEKYYANEIRMLSDVRLANIQGTIDYRDTFVHLNFVDGAPRVHPCVLTELCDDHLRADEPLEEDIVKKIMFDVLTILDKIHDAGVVHTDIKLENIFVLDGEIVIGDMGTSCFEGKPFSKIIGTEAYLAPELITNESYDRGVDIWAAFIMCYELLTAREPFEKLEEDSGEDSGEDSDSLFSVESRDSSRDSSGESGEDVERETREESKESEGYKIDYESNRSFLMRMEAVIGTPPQNFTRRKKSRKYYNKKGRLLGNPEVKHEGLSDKGLSEEAQAFLLEGLQFDRKERISAKNALKHPWLIAHV